MLISKNIFKRFPFFKEMINKIGSDIKFNSVRADGERIILTFSVIPPMSEMKIHEPLYVKFVIDGENQFCQPVINFPEAKVVFGDSLKDFSFEKYKDIVQKSLSNPIFTQITPFSEENLDQIREAINSSILSIYDSYRNQVEGCVKEIIDKDDPSGRYILVNNVENLTKDDIVSNKRYFATLDDAKRALTDAMIKTPSKDLAICDTHESENPDDWEII